MVELLTSPEAWISLITLSALEIVLGIDNVVFISILAGKLPVGQQARVQRLGLSFALLTRLALLFAISWIMGLTAPWFTVFGKAFSGRSLILLAGGLFLLAKSTYELFESLEVEHHGEKAERAGGKTVALLVVQIMLLDIVFSFDSVITAVGMAEHIAIMAAAMIIAMIVMLLFAKFIGDFVNRHPSMKVLALSFLLLIGVLLTAEAFEQHIPKGYIYFAMAFSLSVELVNMRVRKARREPVQLKNRFADDTGA